MSEEVKKCPKCQGNMSDGFMIDRGYQFSISPMRWYQGQPVKKLWFGLVRLVWSDRYPIHAYCCDQCGFIEHYVHDRNGTPKGNVEAK